MKNRYCTQTLNFPSRLHQSSTSVHSNTNMERLFIKFVFCMNAVFFNGLRTSATPDDASQCDRPADVGLYAGDHTVPGCYSTDAPHSLKEPIIYMNEVIRIVLVGKTGVGKSATANTILGNETFKSDFSFESVTAECAKADGEVDGQKVAVIDTPGLFDTSIDEETGRKHVAMSINYASPGPHIFLVVIRLGRFTEEEKKTVEMIQKIFGQDADKYSMVLFTHGDLLKGKPIEELLEKSKDLQELVARCNGQYHVFNNDLKDRSQVSELLKKIRNITEKNGGSHYTNEMFQRAERAIEEEKQRILKEKEEERRKEREEMERKISEKYEQEMRKMKADMERMDQLRAAQQREMEEENRKLREEQERLARQIAENSRSVLEQIGDFVVKLGRGVIEAVQSVGEVLMSL